MIDVLPPATISWYCIHRIYHSVHPATCLAGMPQTLIEVKDVSCSKAPGQPIFAHVNFDVNAGDVIMLQGKSGSG